MVPRASCVLDKPQPSLSLFFYNFFFGGSEIWGLSWEGRLLQKALPELSTGRPQGFTQDHEFLQLFTQSTVASRN